MDDRWEKLWHLTTTSEAGPAEILVSPDDPNVVGARWLDGSVDTWYYDSEQWRPVPRFVLRRKNEE